MDSFYKSIKFPNISLEVLTRSINYKYNLKRNNNNFLKLKVK